MKNKLKILIKGIALLGMFGLLLSCGGGYSGGGTSGISPYTGGGGGGGGSFNSGASQANTASFNTGDGSVIISW